MYLDVVLLDKSLATCIVCCWVETFHVFLNIFTLCVMRYIGAYPSRQLVYEKVPHDCRVTQFTTGAKMYVTYRP
jgi:hypothetical protein